MYRKMTPQETTQARRHYSSPVIKTADMKECPVCHARCFTDMPVCYNCLHAFSDEETRILAFEENRAEQTESAWGGKTVVPEEDPVPVEVLATNAYEPGDISALYDLLPELEGLSEDVGAQVVDVEVSKPIYGSVPNPEQVAGDAASSVEAHVLEGSNAEVSVLGASDAEGLPERADQLMQIVISIHVARDACRRRGVEAPQVQV